jgi:predicted Zn finger-like uncharacterized protein
MNASITIECPNCGTKYKVIEGAIKPRGRTVHCNQCSHKWRVEPAVSVAQDWEERFKPDSLLEPAPPKPEPVETAVEPEEEPAPSQTIDRLGGANPDSGFIVATPQIVSDVDDGHGSKSASVLALAASIAVLVAGVVAFHSQIERAFPPSAQLYRVTGLDKPAAGQGLELKDVHAILTTESTGQTLTIEAKVVNPQKTALAVPVLHATLITDTPPGSKAAQPRHWTLDPGQPRLEPQATANVKGSFDGANTENGKILLTFSADNSPPGK